MSILVEMSDFIRWIIFFILAVPAVVGIVLNAVWFTDAAAKQTLRGTSSLPVIPGLSGCLALVVCPVPDTTVFAWLPLILDVSIPVHLWSWAQGKKKPRSEEEG
ncbi:MAG: hypothetical protein GTO40_12620 [Deltaproteobacteria bacterium]|nr:hypothetical protein [Deltaproteobacteria bacterium]